ncbi:MAG: DUF6478 family protein [Pseudomonadota bacterium]
MLARIRERINLKRHKATQRAWENAVRLASERAPDQLRVLSGYARQQKTQLERIIHLLDSKLMLPLIAADAIRKPMYCDWAYRPEIWRGPLALHGLAGVDSQTMFGDETTVFHDCQTSELTLRQSRNTQQTALAPFGLRMDVFCFDGSFLSLAIDLPQEAAQGLKMTHVLRVSTIMEIEKPLEIFVRLNIRHGPNTEQIVREMPLKEGEMMVEFDLAYVKINERRLERMWLDLIFERPAMNQIVIRDLTLTRRPRAEL